MAKPNRAAGARPSQDEIARRAYELYLQRGSVPGHEKDDWLQAEAELAADAAERETATREVAAPAPSRRSPADTVAGRRDGASGRRTLRQ
ncbi:MAG TPA: DUF2934 domain-containing protein [Polyangia bacterium]|nr:DUF2934 domain-containing protein [Polyangia bacterium]